MVILIYTPNKNLKFFLLQFILRNGIYTNEFALENETHKILRDFQIQMNDPVQVQRSDIVLINKKNLPSARFFISI